MSSLAILGRQPALSRAELEAVLGTKAVTPLAGHALLTKVPDLGKLGGTVKLATIVYEGAKVDSATVDQLVARLPASDKKLTVGLSLYGKFALGDPLRLGMELKKR